MNYLKTDQQQYEYSKKKLPELYQRFNDNEANHQEEQEKLRGKIRRHESIVDNNEMRGE